MKEISRRNFIKGAAATALSLAALFCFCALSLAARAFSLEATVPFVDLLLELAVLLFLPAKALALWLVEMCGRFGKWVKRKVISSRKKGE